MKNCRWGAVCAMTASGVLAGSSCGDPTTLSAEGRVWRATWSEEFLVELSIEEANCFAATVGAQTRLAGPLKDERRDDTPGSVFSAMDSCATDATSGRTARALLLGGWSFEEPSVAEATWNAAPIVLDHCIDGEGGWSSLGSLRALTAACRPVLIDGSAS